MGSGEEVVVEAKIAMDASAARQGTEGTQQQRQYAGESTKESPGGTVPQDHSPSDSPSSQHEGGSQLPESKRTSEGNCTESLTGYLRHYRSVQDSSVSNEESEDIPLPAQGVRENNEEPQKQGDVNTYENDEALEQQLYLRGGWDPEGKQPLENDLFPQQIGSSGPTHDPHSWDHDGVLCCCRALRDWLIPQLYGEGWIWRPDVLGPVTPNLRGGAGSSTPSRSGNTSSNPIDIPRQGGSSSNQGSNSSEHGPGHPGGPYRDPSPLATYDSQGLDDPPRQQWTSNQGGSSQGNGSRNRGGGFEWRRCCEFCGYPKEDEDDSYELEEGLNPPVIMGPEPYARHPYVRIEPPGPVRNLAADNETNSLGESPVGQVSWPHNHSEDWMEEEMPGPGYYALQRRKRIDQLAKARGSAKGKETELHGGSSAEERISSYDRSDDWIVDEMPGPDYYAVRRRQRIEQLAKASQTVKGKDTEPHSESSTGQSTISHELSEDPTVHWIDWAIRDEEQLQQEMQKLSFTGSNRQPSSANQTMNQGHGTEHPETEPRRHRWRPSKYPVRRGDLHRHAVMNRFASDDFPSWHSLPPVSGDVIAGPRRAREGSNLPVISTTSTAPLPPGWKRKKTKSAETSPDNTPDPRLRGGCLCDGILNCFGCRCARDREQRREFGHELHRLDRQAHNQPSSSYISYGPQVQNPATSSMPSTILVSGETLQLTRASGTGVGLSPDRQQPGQRPSSSYQQSGQQETRTPPSILRGRSAPAPAPATITRQPSPSRNILDYVPPHEVEISEQLERVIEDGRALQEIRDDSRRTDIAGPNVTPSQLEKDVRNFFTEDEINEAKEEEKKFKEEQERKKRDHERRAADERRN
ncbi:hypothetical protein MMC10_006967 [Thelotrema lepadinum]|nr:hypothetical protein [Thelotrema lepadinum]